MVDYLKTHNNYINGKTDKFKEKLSLVNREILLEEVTNSHKQGLAEPCIQRLLLN